MSRHSEAVVAWFENPWTTARVTQVALGAAVGLAVVYAALRLFDHYRATEANVLVVVAIVAGVVLLRVGWREVGIGLLIPLVLYIVAGALILVLAGFISLS